MECGDVSCDFVLATQRRIEWVLRGRTTDMAVATMPHAPHHKFPSIRSSSYITEARHALSGDRDLAVYIGVC